MQYLYYVLLYFIEVMKFYIIYKEYFDFYERKKGTKEWAGIAVGIIVIAIIMGHDSFKINPLFVYVPFILWEGALLFETSIFEFIVYSFLAMGIVGMLDLMSTMFIKTIMSLCEQTNTSIQKLFVFLFTLAFLCVVAEVLKRQNKGHRRRISISYMAIFVVLTILNSMILGLFQRNIVMHGKNIYKIVFLFVALGMFFQMAMVLMLAGMNEVYREKNEMNQEYLRMQARHYVYLEKREYETKKFRHDIRNHMLILDNLCKEGEIQKARQYIEKIWGKIDWLTMSISVNHGVVDAVLNQYVSLCNSEGVLFKVQGHMPNQCGIDPFDLCTIFSNLLSNALDAAKETEKKEIKLEIRYDAGTIFIRTENDYVGEREIRDGTVVVKKKDKNKDKNKRGYGLDNIKESVGRYQGIFELETKNNQFIAMIAMQNNI